MRVTHPAPIYIKNAIYRELVELQRKGTKLPAGVFEAVDAGICRANLEHDKRMEESK